MAENLVDHYYIKKENRLLQVFLQSFVFENGARREDF